MRKTPAVVLLLISVVAAFAAGAWTTPRGTAATPAPSPGRILYYVDPMHPSYKSDKPGIAPDCGMELVPVYAGEEAATAPAPDVPLGGANGRAARQELVGVRVAAVEERRPRQALRLLGRVVPDETRTYRINAATDGWVKQVLPVTTDSLVQKDDLLATYYAPEFFSAMKAYLYGLRSLERVEHGGNEAGEQAALTRANLENYRNALRNLGMSERQLDDIMRTRQGGDNVEIRAPEAGFVLLRNLSLGERFQRGTELYRIADLAKVWIVVDTYGPEVLSFTRGMTARVSVPQLQRSFAARVADVPPRFDPGSRTLRVRLEADNPDLLLRPDMFVDVELTVPRPAAIAVPADAVLDTGLRQVAYVERGDGMLEPRPVELGWRDGGQVEVRKGLKAGERIAVSGVFLLDSETRMKAGPAPR